MVSSRAWLAAVMATGVIACTVNSTTNNGSNPCNADSSISCPGNSSGYSCSGTATPEQGDSSLDCGAGSADGSNTDYCCITLGSGTTCAADSSVSGCVSGSYGFSCTGSDTPDQADTSLTCSTGTPGNGDTLYCCTTTGTGPGDDGGTDAGTTCAADSSVTCTGSATGYSCTSTDTPDQENTGLNCSTGTADGNNTDYCCIPLTSGVTCSADSSVQGCQSGSYGFSCTGSDTPDQDDSSLNCSTGTAGTNGTTLYCCTE